MGQDGRDAPFSEKLQRHSRYDGGLEEDGLSKQPLVPIVSEELPAHMPRERRRTVQELQLRRNRCKEVPLIGCELCIAPRYLLPRSFGQKALLHEEGDAHDNDDSQLPGLPWVLTLQLENCSIS